MFGRGGVTVRARYVHFGVVVVLGRARPGPVVRRCTRSDTAVVFGRGGVTVRARYVHFGVVVVLGRARPGPVV